MFRLIRYLLKFIYSEKTTEFCEISTVYLTVTTQDKSTVEISQKFVAFSEYMNLKKGPFCTFQTTLSTLPRFSSIRFYLKSDQDVKGDSDRIHFIVLWVCVQTTMTKTGPACKGQLFSEDFFFSPDTPKNHRNYLQISALAYSEVPNRRACSLRFFRFSFHPAGNFSCNKRKIPPCSFIDLLRK